MSVEHKELKLNADQFVFNDNDELIIRDDDLAQVISEARVRESSTEQGLAADDVEVSVTVKVKF